MEQWEAATEGADSIIIGDLNLDYNHWESPIGSSVSMIENTKTTIGSSGFYQVIRGNTHTWPGAQDSLLDHCWVNVPEKVIATVNDDNAASDHNIIGIILRIIGVENNCQPFKNRKWQNFDPATFNQKVGEINWDQMYELTDTNLVWDYIESHLVDILKVEAPVIKCQPRNKHKVWIFSKY